MGVSAKRIALCAILIALGVVLMVLGAALELGIYVCPLLVGLSFVIVRMKYGIRYQVVVYIATGLLCLIFVPNIEENLVFLGFLGWYPIARPALQRLPKVVSWLIKLLIFNAAIFAIEWLVIRFFVPETIADMLLAVLLLLANITFVVYDLAIPRLTVLLERIFKEV